MMVMENDPVLTMVDDMLAEGWKNDPHPDRAVAYIGVGQHFLVVIDQDSNLTRYKLERLD